MIHVATIMAWALHLTFLRNQMHPAHVTPTLRIQKDIQWDETKRGETSTSSHAPKIKRDITSVYLRHGPLNRLLSHGLDSTNVYLRHGQLNRLLPHGHFCDPPASVRWASDASTSKGLAWLQQKVNVTTNHKRLTSMLGDPLDLIEVTKMSHPRVEASAHSL